MQENKDAAAIVEDTKPTGKQKKETKQDQKPATTRKQALMYLGPNIPGGIIFHGHVFKCDEVDEILHIKGICEKLPEIKELFFEVKKVPKTKQQLMEQGTEVYGLYKYVEQQIDKGVLKNGV